MKVISLLNEKGGVGKTTLAMHLASGLAIRGYRTLLIDADAQGNATAGFGLAEEPGFYDLLVRQAAWNDVLRVLPAEAYEPPSQPAKGLLAILPGNGETQLIAQKIDDAYAIQDRLSELEGNIDVVVFDTSPTPSLLHGAIYLATDAILYPTLCETFSLQGLIKTMKHHESFAQSRKAQTGRMINTLGIVPTMYRAKTVEHSENLNELKSRFGDKVWDPLPLRITWSEANTLRRPVFNVAPDSSAAQDAWGAVDRAIREITYV
jgi:chromosome partitioning protein